MLSQVVYLKGSQEFDTGCVLTAMYHLVLKEITTASFILMEFR